MTHPRRAFLHLAAGAAALPVISCIARAEVYPTRPVRIIVGFPAGGPTDIVARLMAQWLSEHLGQEFVVENRPGAASNIGTEAALKAPPDGYTLLQVTSTNAVNVTFYENKLSFNFMSDIAPVAGIIRVPFVMEINPSVPPSIWKVFARAQRRFWVPLSILILEKTPPAPDLQKTVKPPRVRFDFAPKRATWRTVRSARPNIRVPAPSRGQIDLEGAWGPPHAHVS
jgi:hypothetical protein